MPDYPDELMIGTFAGGEAGMVAISSLGQGTYAWAISRGAFTVDPAHRSRVVQLGDGSLREQGWTQAAWHINGLRGEQYDAIIAYKTAMSTQLYIRTLMNDGSTYANYLATAIFPVKPVRGNPTDVEDGVVEDFTISFIQMIQQ